MGKRRNMSMVGYVRIGWAAPSRCVRVRSFRTFWKGSWALSGGLSTETIISPPLSRHSVDFQFKNTCLPTGRTGIEYVARSFVANSFVANCPVGVAHLRYKLGKGREFFFRFGINIITRHATAVTRRPSASMLFLFARFNKCLATSPATASRCQSARCTVASSCFRGSRAAQKGRQRMGPRR